MKQLLILITVFSWALGISAQEKGKVKTVEDTISMRYPPTFPMPRLVSLR